MRLDESEDYTIGFAKPTLAVPLNGLKFVAS